MSEATVIHVGPPAKHGEVERKWTRPLADAANPGEFRWKSWQLLLGFVLVAGIALGLGLGLTDRDDKGASPVLTTSTSTTAAP